MYSLHSLEKDGPKKSTVLDNSPLLQFLMDYSEKNRNIEIEHSQKLIITLETDGADKERISNERIDAGWTYFGQFISHDITIRRELGDPVPRLNLDSLYGAGPKSNAHLYEMERDAFDDYTFRGVRFLLNSYITSTGDKVNDVYRTGPLASAPIMGDVRNDDNFILNQLHCAFMRFHNQVAEYFMGEESLKPEALFRKTRKFVTQTYQWLIVHEYLPLLTGIGAQTLIDSGLYKILAYKNRRLKPPVLMPEFNMATFRIGHSQVRSFYRINSRSIAHLFHDVGYPEKPTLRGFMRNKNRGPVDWRFMFTFDQSPFPKVEKSRPIDVVIAASLGALPFFQPKTVESNLSLTNIKRSIDHQLVIFETDLQYIRDALQIPTISSFSVLNTIDSNQDTEWLQCKEYLLGLDAWPLWVFILVEAMVLGAEKYHFQKVSQHLGPLGAQIIAEQMMWVLEHDPDSFLNADQAWNPMNDLSKHYLPIKGNFSIVDVLHIAESGIYSQR